MQLAPRGYLYNEKYGEVIQYEKKDISGYSFAKNVRVNEFTGVSEPKIVCNPKENNILAVTSNDFSLDGNSSRIFISEDYGLNWQAKEIPLSAKFKKSSYSDPWLDYDTDGNLYFITVQKDVLNYDREAIYFSRSEDNGTTWQRNYFIEINAKGSIYLDKPKIFIDKTSSRKNSIYVTWVEMKGLKTSLMFSKSTDLGNTFAVPVKIESDDVDYCSVTGDSKGNIFVSYLKDESKICIKKSTDAGESWFKEPGCLDIKPAGSKYENQFIIKKGADNGIRINSEPNLAVTAENDLIITYSASGKNNDVADIYFAKIKNNTEEVSIPVKVNSDRTLNDQFLPAISTDDHNNIFITYQDSRNDAGNILTETYISVSTDGGLSFSDEKFSTAKHNPSSAAVGKYFGDYNSCVVSGGKLIAVWTDGRNNNFDVYAGIINVKDLIESKRY
ncbi:MAG: exo-alpha-sialidase [Ignavibacteria bacterium]|nr:exo-alpha-sialidase [Ignavibacteria bacterium]